MWSEFFKIAVEADKKNNETRVLATLIELDLKTNLQILNAIDLDSDEIRQGDSELAKVAKSLKFESILAVLLENEKQKSCWEDTIDYLNEGLGETANICEPKTDNRTIRHVLLSVYKSILTLQAISNIDPDICKNLRLKVRLNNLKKNMIGLVKHLDKKNSTRREYKIL